MSSSAVAAQGVAGMWVVGLGTENRYTSVVAFGLAVARTCGHVGRDLAMKRRTLESWIEGCGIQAGTAVVACEQPP